MKKESPKSKVDKKNKGAKKKTTKSLKNDPYIRAKKALSRLRSRI